MNDPKGTKQGEPQQGTTGQTSQGTEGTSQGKISETLTRAEVEKLISDERAKAGRELKTARTEAEQYKSSHSKLESELNETRNRMNEIQKRIDEADEEKAKDTPEGLRQYQEDRRLRKEKEDLRTERQGFERERTEHASELSAAKEAKAEMAIISAAVEYHVDIGKLKEKVQKFGLTTDEQISDLAETLAGQGTSDGDGKRKIPQGDSGRTIGGTSLGSLSPKELLDEIDKKLRTK